MGLHSDRAVKLTARNLFISGFFLAAGLGAAAWLHLTGAAIHNMPTREGLIAALWRHVGYGVVLAPALAGYLLWRFFQLRRAQPEARTFLTKLSFIAVAGALLFLTLSGPIIVWTYGAPLRVFDWFVVANPVGKRPVIYETFEAVHVAVARATPWLIAADLAFFALMLKMNRRNQALGEVADSRANQKIHTAQRRA